MDDIFDLLASRCDQEGFTYADGIDLDRWANARGLSISDFLDSIGVEIARRYQARERSFDFCDSLVNDLQAELVIRMASNEDVRQPDVFIEVYLAFDAGEFHRLADQSDDPIADFTDPLIDAFVARLRTA
jgi:hypothetical protein